MATPVIDSISTDHASYVVGAVITATVAFHDPDAKSYTLSGTATDAEGNHIAATVAFAVTDLVTVALSDGSARVWTLTTVPGASPAIFTATA